MNNTTNKRNTNIGEITYATKFASKAKPYEIFMNKSVTPHVLSYKNGNNEVSPVTDLTAIQEDLDSLTTDLSTLSDQLPLTATVNMTAADILTSGSSPFTLLPTLPANQYYSIDRVLIEFTDNGTPYTLGNSSIPYFFISLNATANIFVQKAFITTAGSKAMAVNAFEGGLDTVNLLNYQFSGNALTKSIQFKTWSNTNPTLGNGTLKFKFTYFIVTFG